MVNIGKPHQKHCIQKGQFSPHVSPTDPDLCNRCFGSIVVQPAPSLWRCSLEPDRSDERCFGLGYPPGSDQIISHQNGKRKIIELKSAKKGIRYRWCVSSERRVELVEHRTCKYICWWSCFNNFCPNVLQSSSLSCKWHQISPHEDPMIVLSEMVGIHSSISHAKASKIHFQKEHPTVTTFKTYYTWTHVQ